MQLNNCLLDRINLKTVVDTPSVTEYYADVRLPLKVKHVCFL